MGTKKGSEHLVIVHVWSAARGKEQAHEILGGVRAALHDRPLSLVDHSLINLRHEYSEPRRTSDGETIRGLARFRAVTEPAWGQAQRVCPHGNWHRQSAVVQLLIPIAVCRLPTPAYSPTRHSACMNRSRRGTRGGRCTLVGTPRWQASTTGGALLYGRTSVFGAASAAVALTTEIRAIPSLAIRTLRFAGKASSPCAGASVHARHAPDTGNPLLGMT
jgi:hypothetical protein